MYQGHVTAGEPTTSREASEVRYFSPEEIPWNELAYDTTRWALRDWLKSKGR